MTPLWENVKQVMCYHNLDPKMPSPYGPLGGGEVELMKGNTTTKVTTKNIAEQHLLVQKDMALHRETVNMVMLFGIKANNIPKKQSKKFVLLRKNE